ncbi:hypothetical protein DL89DRAFT_290890 [Linderina pennispora]|uniref:Uncharacterized protein n=1 Tax=Linderina pennispora TaxID=61395 RepID=A0A1Y1WII5_9FUNG|nr:uncharacterized protein DL89DRAFT_290890 [Linderina pennispora]ORX73138.1 hypothetical protein DL89DRAFT_290890 [Linderina pennispora]
MTRVQQQAGKARRLVLHVGACISANIETIGKHVCDAQFQTFKGCMQQVMKRKW